MYIGDSHALIGSLMFDDVERKQRITTATYTHWGFNAYDLCNDEGYIGSTLISILRMSSALHSAPNFPPLNGFPPQLIRVGRWERGENLQVTNFSREHPYVLCVGDLNQRGLVKELSEDRLDIEVPFDIGGVANLERSNYAATVNFDRICTVVTDTFGSILRGLQILRAAGFSTLYLHCLPPPTTDPIGLKRVLGYHVDISVHYKLSMLINLTFARACAQIGVGFIDTWPLVTENELRKPEFELDPIHLNGEHALLSVQEVHRQFTSGSYIQP